MKVRNTSYVTNPYGSTATSKVAEKAGVSAAEVAEAAPVRAAEQTTVLGIPTGELTPKVQAALDRLMAEVERMRGELEQARRRVDHLEQLADQDALTPVLNRRAFVRELSRIMAFSERHAVPSAVVYFDVNGLKQVNDTYGHAAGDAVLGHVADMLVRHVRSSDIVGRLGGDEFGVILVQADVKEAASKAAMLSNKIDSEPAVWKDQPLTIRASFGVHNLVAGQEAQDALDAADRAMYAHKRGNGQPTSGV